MDMKPEFGLLCDDAQLSRLVLQVAADAGVELAILDSKNLTLNPDLIIMAQPELTADLKPGSVQALITSNLTEQVWQEANRLLAKQVIELPAASNWLESWLRSHQTNLSLLVTIRSVTSSGGASILSCALAQADTAQQNSVLIDLDFWRSNLLLLTGLEQTKAVSWHQLELMNSAPSASALYEGLPSQGIFKLLTQSRTSFTIPSNDTILTAINLLREKSSLVIVDQGTLRNELTNQISRKADLEILVSPCTLLGVDALKRELAETRGKQLVILRQVSRSDLKVRDAVDFLNLNNFVSLQSDEKLIRDIADGVLPGERKHSQLAKVSRSILDLLGVQ
jgi:MinD superfamily P-loop ATPase